MLDKPEQPQDRPVTICRPAVLATPSLHSCTGTPKPADLGGPGFTMASLSGFPSIAACDGQQKLPRFKSPVSGGLRHEMIMESDSQPD